MLLIPSEHLHDITGIKIRQYDIKDISTPNLLKEETYNQIYYKIIIPISLS